MIIVYFSLSLSIYLLIYLHLVLSLFLLVEKRIRKKGRRMYIECDEGDGRTGDGSYGGKGKAGETTVVLLTRRPQ